MVYTVFGRAGGCFDVVCPTEQSFVMQRELFAGGQLTLAGVAREARQMVHVIAGLAHPVGRSQHSLTLGTLERHRSARTHTVTSQQHQLGRLPAHFLPKLSIQN